ncbi:MAG: diguanylate cyclase [Acidobacteria bacterium]|nr:MAG: diguanylate cyclase [Acidobacteriota bacterium]
MVASEITEIELDRDKLLREVAELVGAGLDRSEKIQKIADTVRLFGNYRWVGIYDVDEHQISVIAWSGIGAPAYPRFRVTQGLSGEAVRTRRTVISNDVANDPRYLTAFGNTQSEIIVPIIAEPGGPVIGTIDVESDQTDAFGNDDRLVLEECASLLAQL